MEIENGFYESKKLSFAKEDLTKISKEEIIFMDTDKTNSNLILLLSSESAIYICEVGDTIKIKMKLEDIVDKYINIIKAYFTEDNNKLLLFCNNNNIVEYTINRQYISHIYNNCFSNLVNFQMNINYTNNFKNLRIQNFAILNDDHILKVWNLLKDNKENPFTINKTINFCYDKTGLALYLIIAKSKFQSYNKINIYKFENEMDCKEIFYKLLEFINYDVIHIDTFETKVILLDSENNIYILNNYPMDKSEYVISLANNEFKPTLFVPIRIEQKDEKFNFFFSDSETQYFLETGDEDPSVKKLNGDCSKIFSVTKPKDKENEKDKGKEKNRTIVQTFNNKTKTITKYLM